MFFFYFNFKEIYKKKYVFFICRLISLFISLIWLPLALLIVILKPLIFIRVGHLNSARIGHLVKETNLYLLGERLIRKKNTLSSIDLFFKSPTTCNKVILEIFNNLGITVIPRFFIFHLYFWLKLLNKKHIIQMAPLDRDLDHLVLKSPIIFKLPKKYKLNCEKIIQNLGIPSKAKIVLLMSRDNFYLEKSFSKNHCIDNFRNIPIEDFKSSVEFLLSKGYYVFRMGNIAKERLNINSENFFDYPFSSFKSAEMDIYLSSRCDFCISVATGLDQLAVMFKKPILYVNMVPFGHAQTNPSLIIFKKLFSNKLNRLLTFKEIMNSNLAHAFNSEEYIKANVTLINNNEDEILNSLKEFIKSVKSSKISLQKFSESQKYFHKIWAKTKYHGQLRYGFISETFIDSNKDLFEI